MAQRAPLKRMPGMRVAILERDLSGPAAFLIMVTLLSLAPLYPLFRFGPTFAYEPLIGTAMISLPGLLILARVRWQLASNAAYLWVFALYLLMYMPYVLVDGSLTTVKVFFGICFHFIYSGILLWNCQRLLDRAALSTVVRLYLAAATAAVVAALVNTAGEERLTLVSGYNPTWFGFYCALAVAAALELIRGARTLLGKYAYSAAAVVNGLALLLSQSRTYLAALLLAFGLYFLYRLATISIQGKLRTREVWITALVVLLVLLVPWDLLGQSFDFSRLARLTGETSMDRITSGRWTLWGNALEEWANASTWELLFGLGVGTYYYTHDMFVHSQLLTDLHGRGLVGLLVFLVLCFALAISMRRIWSSLPCVIVGLLVTFSLVLNDALSFKYFWIGVILFFVLAKLRREEDQSRMSAWRQRDAVWGSAGSPEDDR